MDQEWTEARHALLEHLVDGLLAFPLAPAVRLALTEQRQWWNRACDVVGHQEQVIAALTEEVEELRAIIEGESEPWDKDDDAW